MSDQVMRQIHEIVQSLDESNPNTTMENWNQACDEAAA